MNIADYIQSKALHHAYVLYAEPVVIRESLLAFLSDHNVETIANPDFHYISEDALGIDTIRSVIERASLSSNSEKKVFVLACRIITEPAQNAMLKLFEEPTSGTHFFIVTPTRGNLLPTLLSRVVAIDMQGGGDQSTAKKFLAGSYSDRMKIIEAILDEKDRTAGQKLVSDTMSVVHSGKSELKTEALQKLLFVHNYITTPSSSLKMLLEYLALTLPQI